MEENGNSLDPQIEMEWDKIDPTPDNNSVGKNPGPGLGDRW